MPKLKKLLIPLLEGKRILLWHQKYNDGTEEKQDIIIYDLFAKCETYRWNPGNPDIVISLQKSNYTNNFDIQEVYRMPIIENLTILEEILKQAIVQSHV